MERQGKEMAEMMYGFAVTVCFMTTEGPMSTTLRNVTEIRRGKKSVVFESEIHETGIFCDTKDIVEFEALPETDIAREF